jgi:hypothetical protein
VSRKTRSEARKHLTGQTPQTRWRLVYDADGVHLDDYAAELFVGCNRCGGRLAHLRARILGAPRDPVWDPPDHSFGDGEKQRAIFRQMLDPKIQPGETITVDCPSPTCQRPGIQMSSDRLLDTLFDAWRDSQLGDRAPRRVGFQA